MKIVRLLAALAAFATTALLFAAPASAQATRTWVSGTGDDANPCSRTAPCKTFAGAISKTAASGEINCLDPAGFGTLTITKAITIDCESVSNGGVLVSGSNGIVVAVGASDYVQLIGLDIDGLGPTITSLNGVKMQGAGNLAIINCLIYGFQNSNGIDGNGVLLAGTTGAHVYLNNSIVRDNTNGVAVVPQSAVANAITIDHDVLDSNLVANLTVGGATGVVVLNGSSLLAAPSAISNPGGGSIFSYGNNALRGAGAPTATIPLE